MLVGWAILSPVAKHSGWAPGPVGDMTTGSRGWILWVSLAIMCADSLISLLPVIAETFYKKVWRGAITLPGGDVDGEKEMEPPERLVPMRWVAWGLGGSVVSGTVLVWAVFGDEGIKPWATFIGFVMGGLLSVLGYVVATSLLTRDLAAQCVSSVYALSERQTSIPSAALEKSVSYFSRGYNLEMLLRISLLVVSPKPVLNSE